MSESSSEEFTRDGIRLWYTFNGQDLVSIRMELLIVQEEAYIYDDDCSESQLDRDGS